MRYENHLREAVAQAAQQREDVLAPRLVERAEDFVEHEQRERLPRALGDHLRDGEPQYKIRDVLFSTRDHRLRNPLVEHDDAVILVQIDLIVTRIGEIR